MVTQRQLAEVFNRWLRSGVETLSPFERGVFRIQEFILEYDPGGQSGYLYNRLPDLAGIEAAVEAMRQHRLADLATLLSDAARLFAGYAEPTPATTWASVCERYAPTGRLDALDRRIAMLDDYGLE